MAIRSQRHLPTNFNKRPTAPTRLPLTLPQLLLRAVVYQLAGADGEPALLPHAHAGALLEHALQDGGLARPLCDPHTRREYNVISGGGGVRPTGGWDGSDEAKLTVHCGDGGVEAAILWEFCRRLGLPPQFNFRGMLKLEIKNQLAALRQLEFSARSIEPVSEARNTWIERRTTECGGTGVDNLQTPTTQKGRPARPRKHPPVFQKSPGAGVEPGEALGDLGRSGRILKKVRFGWMVHFEKGLPVSQQICRTGRVVELR